MHQLIPSRPPEVALALVLDLHGPLDEEMPWENIILHLLLSELSFLRSGTTQTLSGEWKLHIGKSNLVNWP